MERGIHCSRRKFPLLDEKFTADFADSYIHTYMCVRECIKTAFSFSNKHSKTTQEEGESKTQTICSHFVRETQGQLHRQAPK